MVNDIFCRRGDDPQAIWRLKLISVETSFQRKSIQCRGRYFFQLFLPAPRSSQIEKVEIAFLQVQAEARGVQVGRNAYAFGLHR